MSVLKQCAVCGGRITPTRDVSDFGYCENCGIVYLLRDGLLERPHKGPPGAVEKALGRPYETKDKPGEIESISVAGSPPSSSYHWRCPDCDAVMEFDNEADLDFVKREHIREYHPNR